MRTACVVQARLTSTRLPGKAMLSLGGEPAIRHVLRRCKEIPGIDQVICAVPEERRVTNGLLDYSAPIEREARALGILCIAGSEHDVLGRYWKAALAVNAGIIMRVTGDCPLIDPEVCGRVLALVEDGVDYASNVDPRGFPKGLDCEAFTFEALKRAHEEAVEPEDREHVTPFMRRNLHCVNLDGDGDPDLRWTLDTMEDYLFLSEKFA